MKVGTYKQNNPVETNKSIFRQERKKRSGMGSNTIGINKSRVLITACINKPSW